MNKNFSLILNIVLAIAVAVLYYLHFADKMSTTASTSTNSDTTLAKLPEVTPGILKKSKTVFVNIDSLLANYSYYKKTNAELEARRIRIQKQLETQQIALEQQYRDAQEKDAKGLFLSEDDARNTQIKLSTLQQNLLTYKEKEERAFANDEQKFNKKLYDYIHNYIKRYCAKANYEYVLGYNGGYNILYASDSLDITSDVLSGLNKEAK
jgi:outer membrane protein